jgi:hypothetical protein
MGECSGGNLGFAIGLPTGGAVHSGTSPSGTGYFGPSDAVCGALLEAACRDGPAWPTPLSAAAPPPISAEAATGVSLLLAARVSLIGALSGWLKHHPAAHVAPLVSCVTSALWHRHPFTVDAAIGALLAISHQIPEQWAADGQALPLLFQCARQLPASTSSGQRLCVLQSAARVVATAPTQHALEALLTPVAAQFAERAAQLEDSVQRAVALGAFGSPAPTLDPAGSLCAQRAALVEACALLAAVIRPLRPLAALLPTASSVAGGGHASAAAGVIPKGELRPPHGGHPVLFYGGLPVLFLQTLWPVWIRAFRLACHMATVGGLDGSGGGSSGAPAGASGGTCGGGNRCHARPSWEGGDGCGDAGSPGDGLAAIGYVTPFGTDGEADALVEALTSVAAACAWSCEGGSSCELSSAHGERGSAFLPTIDPMAAELIEAMRCAGEACGGLADP